MKRNFILSMCVVSLLSGCGTYAEQGGSTGAMFGSIIGSAIGGISGGPRGHDIGTLVGMAGGAMVGAAIGAAADNAEQAKYEKHRRERENRRPSYQAAEYGADESGFDATNSGDDRIEFEPSDTQEAGFHVGTSEPAEGMPAADMSVNARDLAVAATEKANRHHHDMSFVPLIEIRHATFSDADGDGAIVRGEECRVTFDIMNHSHEPVCNIRPIVTETTGNKHIHISPSITVESIAPGRGVRYTAMLLADSRLKDGEAVIRLAVARGDSILESQTREFTLATKKK